MYKKQLFEYFKNELKCSDEKAKQLANEQYSAVDGLSNIQLSRTQEPDKPTNMLYVNTEGADEGN
ncbi:hypothetical protein C7T36_14715 [Rhodococcus sp. AD45-ID]|nr:hypothetical protein C7T36_14715 [Rhodococcus sp. AD45-ID]